MKSGDRVIWIFSQRYFNNAKTTRRIKRGEFINLVRHTVKHHGPQLAAVRFDNQKRMSKVPLYQLSLETERE